MKSKGFYVLIALFVGLGAAYVEGQFGQQPAELELVRLADDLYVSHNELVPGNTTVLLTDEGVVLIDDKFEIDFDNIVAQVRTLTDQPIRYVVNTHHHGDHTGGNVKAQAMDARIVASEAAFRNMVFASQPGQPSLTFDGRSFIHLGGKTIELYQFGRAHTDGDVVALFPDHGVLAAGDIFTFGDDVPQLIDYAGGGSAKEWTRTLDSVLGLNFDRVIPGHGPVTTREELRNFRESTVRLQNRVREVLGEGQSRDQIAQMLRDEFNWQELHLGRGLDGLIGEMR